MSPGTWPRVIALALSLALFCSGLGIAAAPALSAGGTGGIAGQVTGPADLSEVEVCVLEARPSETCTFAKANGTYLLDGLPGGFYQVEFLPPHQSGYVIQYYNHKAKLSQAQTVHVKEGEKTNGINADLERGAVIEGQAVDELTLLPLEDVEVCAQSTESIVPAGCDHTDLNGEYAITTLPTGSYRIGFWGEGKSAAYAPRFYEEETDFFEATPVAVTNGTTTVGINAQLLVGARVEGTVTDAGNGARLAGVAVCILKTGSAAPERCAVSDGQGEYTLPGVSSGTYDIAFSPEFNEFTSKEFVLPEEDGYQTQFYAGASTRAAATHVSLAAPAVSGGIDASLLSTGQSPAPLPPPPVPVSAPAAPETAPRAKPQAKKCKRGFHKRRVKGTVKCVKKKQRAKHRKHRHRRHGKRAAGSR
jgi:hypothetical protein